MKRNQDAMSNPSKRLCFIEKLMDDLQDSVANQTDVSLSLAKHVISTHAKDNNFIFSPLLLHVLSLIAAGSKGPSQDQLLSFLKSKSIKQLNLLFSEIVSHVLNKGCTSGGPQLSSANSVWVDQRFPLKPTFQAIVDNTYEGVKKNTDFGNKDEARNEVNMWVEKETMGLIKETLPPGSVDESAWLLANAVYFNVDWAVQFNANCTEDLEFFLLNGSSVRVPFMAEHMTNHYIRAFDSFKVLRLPYQRGGDSREFSMYIYLPDAKEGLPSLIEKICSESGFIDSHLPYKKVQVSNCLRVPKFKIQSGFNASNVLKGQGVELPFRLDGLSEMDGRDVFVSDIFLKSFIEVSERGTVAAAANGAMLGGGCIEPEEYLEFVADHSFFFVIQEDTTGIVLFIGQVLNPLLL